MNMDEKTATMIRTEHENVINSLDEKAFKEALHIRRVVPGAAVTAISMGPRSLPRRFVRPRPPT